MSTLKKFFPNAFGAKDVKSLVIALVIYVVISAAAGLVLGFLGGIPVLGLIFRVIGWLVEVYCVAGIVLSVLAFLKIVK